MTRDALLALGFLLSPATQLRPGSGSVGPGEVCFALWLALSILRNFGREDLALGRAPTRILTFWLLFAVALCIGSLTSYAMGIHNDPALFRHDVQAYLLVAGISFFCVLEPDAAARLNRVAWLLAIFGSAFLALQLANAWQVFDIADIDPWYWDRMRGWSENPNQLALMCLVIGFVALHLAETAPRPGQKLAAFALTLVPFFVGLQTKSDSFMLVLAIACPALAVLKIGKWIRSDEARPGVRWALAWLCVLALPVILVFAAPAAYVTAGKAEVFERQFVQDNREAVENDAPVRFELWKEAIGIGMSTSMLGLGPGPHLLRVKPANVTAGEGHAEFRRPSEDPAADFEIHNTMLDLLTQGGMMASLSFAWLCVSTWLMTVRARLDSLAILMGGLALFSTFHFIVRHPLLWFVIGLCLAAAAAATHVRPQRAREGG